MRKGKKQVKEQTVEVTQQVMRTGVQGESFDLILRFTKNIDQPELFMDELVKLVLEGLLDQYGRILVKVNWFAEGLTVIAPDAIPQNDNTQDAPEGP